MEWLQLQPISRQESGFVEDAGAIDDVDDARPLPRCSDVSRRSLPASTKLKSGRKWKFLSRKSSWRSL